jgi:hypothetical protein
MQPLQNVDPGRAPSGPSVSHNNDDRAGFSGDYFLPELFDSGEQVPMAFPDPVLIQVPQYQTDTIQVNSIFFSKR